MVLQPVAKVLGSSGLGYQRSSELGFAGLTTLERKCYFTLMSTGGSRRKQTNRSQPQNGADNLGIPNTDHSRKYPQEEQWYFGRLKEFPGVDENAHSDDVCVRQRRMQHCRDYEYLREAVLHGGLQATGEPLGVGIGEDVVQVSLAQAGADAGQDAWNAESKSVILPAEAFHEGFEKTPFLRSEPKVVRAFDQLDARVLELDLARMNDELEWDSPLTRFPAEKLLSLIPESLLKSASIYGKIASRQVSRKKFGKGYRVGEAEKRLEEVDLHLTLEVDHPVSEAACRIPGGAEERWEGLAEEIGGPEWVEHYKVEVLDWKGRRYTSPDGCVFLCTDIDKWVKTWQGPEGGLRSIAAFQIDWSKPDSVLKAWFSAWLKKHRPHPPVSATGKATEAERNSMDLLALAYLRLYRFFRVEKGMRTEDEFIEELQHEGDKWPDYVTRLKRSQIISYLRNAKKILRKEFGCKRVDIGKPKRLCREDFL